MQPDSRIEALAIAFVELSKMLGRADLISVTQLATAIETAAKAAGTNEATKEAADALARRLYG